MGPALRLHAIEDYPHPHVGQVNLMAMICVGKVSMRRIAEMEALMRQSAEWPQQRKRSREWVRGVCGIG